MLNGNDVQLFYKLLDSLSTSLRDLAVKYELLVSASTRQANEREKTDSTVIDMAREVTSSFASMTRDFEYLKKIISEGREHDVKFETVVQSMVKTMESLDSKMEDITHVAGSIVSNTNEGKAVSLHIDSHMDAFGNQLASLQSTYDSVEQMCIAVEQMKKQFDPFRKLAVLFTKPVKIIIALYIVFVTIIAVVEGIKQVDKLKDKIIGASTNILTQTTNNP